MTTQTDDNYCCDYQICPQHQQWEDLNAEYDYYSPKVDQFGHYEGEHQTLDDIERNMPCDMFSRRID
jgi:hypothetical protein